MRNLPYGFDIYLVNVNTIRQVAQIFVAFSEKLNFNDHPNSIVVVSKEDRAVGRSENPGDK